VEVGPFRNSKRREARNRNSKSSHMSKLIFWTTCPQMPIPRRNWPLRYVLQNDFEAYLATNYQ